MIKKCNPSQPILGFSDTQIVKLDFDDVPFKFVKYWALRTMKWFRLQGFLILKSSKNCYHVVFNCKVSWKKNVHIVAWVCLESKNEGLAKWFLMQCIKESSTLRISTKGGKPSPRVVYRHGKQNGEIQNYLKHRSLVQKIREKSKSSRVKGGDVFEKSE